MHVFKMKDKEFGITISFPIEHPIYIFYSQTLQPLSEYTAEVELGMSCFSKGPQEETSPVVVCHTQQKT